MALANQGVLNPGDIPVGMINKVVAVIYGGETPQEVTLGSVRDVNINITEERFLHKDNSKYQATVVDQLLSVSGEVTFTVEEWNAANLALITGAAADVSGKYYLGARELADIGLQFFHEHSGGKVFAFGVYKCRLNNAISLALSGNANYPLPVKATILQDYSGAFGAPLLDGVRPLVYVTTDYQPPQS